MPPGGLTARIAGADGSNPPPHGSDFYSHAPHDRDDSGFAFRATCGTDDSGFNLRASRGPDDSSRCLIGCARLATSRPTGASCAVD
jgi:hypothetical protein